MAAWGQAEHPSAVGEQLHCATLVFLELYFFVSTFHYKSIIIVIYYCQYQYYNLFQLLSCSYLHLCVFPFFWLSSPSHQGQGGRELLCCDLELNHNTRDHASHTKWISGTSPWVSRLSCSSFLQGKALLPSTHPAVPLLLWVLAAFCP